jgi:colicin import membrane protein
MSARTDALNQPHDEHVRMWVGMTAVSILCHLIFFSGVLFLPQLRSSRSYIPSAVEVDLVSLPPSRAGSQVPAGGGKKEAVRTPEKPKPAKKKIETEKPKEAPAPVPAQPKETVSLAPKPLEVKRSLKQKTYDPSKAIKSAIAKIEKEAPESRPHEVREAIERLKKEDAESERGVVMRSGGTSGGTQRGAPDLFDIYNAEIWQRIRDNWAFSEALAGGRRDWEAIVIVKIMKDGHIMDTWFETRSGNSYFDDSALKAVKKSDPLPPLPEAYREPYYEVGLHFDLSALQ